MILRMVAVGAALSLAASGVTVSAQVPDVIAGDRYGSIQGERARVYFVTADSLVAVRVLSLIDSQAPLPGIEPDMPSRVSAVLAHGAAAFDELTGGMVPEWSAGVAMPDLQMLVIPTGTGPRVLDPEGLRTLRHEWAHLGLHQYLGDLRVPRWFDEGYAQWAAGGFDATEAWRLRVLLALGRAPALDSVTLAWPVAREEARSAYLLAASAIAYLLEPSGERGLALFLERWRSGRSFDVALVRTFGVTSEQLEGDWKAHVRRRYGWLFVVSRSSAVWFLMAVALMALSRSRRARNLEKLARLRANDAPDHPTPVSESSGSVRLPPGVAEKP